MVLFPIVTTLLALGCLIAVARDYMMRPKPSGAAWSVAFAIFAGAAFLEVVGTMVGWSAFLARSYYVLGATLVVGYLALGELYLLMRRDRADRIAGFMIVVTALAVALVSRAEVGPGIKNEGWHALEPGAGLTALTIAINSIGTVILVGGLFYSAYTFKRRGIMRHRMIGCLLIAIGTLVVASGGTFTRLGSHQYLYIAMSPGIAFIFAGYMRARAATNVSPTPLPSTTSDQVHRGEGLSSSSPIVSPFPSRQGGRGVR